MKWQPIETAPQNGTEVLVWDWRDGFFVAFWYDKLGEWLWTSHDLDGFESLTPTHWMPLPEPPDET